MNITETAQWENGIHQIARSERVSGGADGVANIQAQQLANRTQHLKKTIDTYATLKLSGEMPYSTEADAQSAINAGTIQAGALFSVRSTAAGVWVEEYKNNAGVMVKTGKKILSAESSCPVVAASANDPDGTLSGLAVTVAGQYFAVIGQDNSDLSFYMNNSGAAARKGRFASLDDFYKRVHLLTESAGCFAEHGGASLNTVAATMNRVSDMIKSGTKTLNIDSNGVLVINKITDATPPDTTLTVKNNGVEVLSFTVLPDETLSAGKVESPWFLVSSLSGKNPSQVIFQEGVARLIFRKEDFPDVGGVDYTIDRYRVVDKTYRFAPETANGAPFSVVPCVSNTGSGDVQFAIPVTLIDAAGYPLNSAGVTAYFKAVNPEVNIWCRPNTGEAKRWHYNSLAILPLTAGSVEITVDASVKAVDISVFSAPLVKRPAPSAINEALFRNAAAYRNLVYSGHTGDVREVSSPVSSLLTFDSLSASTVAASGRLSIQVDNMPAASVFFPGYGSVLSGDTLIAPFDTFSLSECAQYRVAEITDTVARIQFTIPQRITGAFNTITTEYVIDTAGVFAPSTYNVASNVTRNSVSATTSLTPRVIQLCILIADIVAAGYDYTDPASIEACAIELARRSQFLVYTGITKRMPGMGAYFTRELPAGRVSLTYENNNCAGFLTIKNGQALKPVDAGKYIFQSADILNDTAYDYSGFPLELKVRFDPGQVGPDNALYLVDDDGKEIACQFADELHPNLRNPANMGYHYDGSLACGSVLFYDDLPAGAQKYYQLKAYSRPRLAADLPVITQDLSTLTIGFGGYTFTFDLARNWQLNAVTDPAGNVTRVQHGNFFAAHDTAVLQSVFLVNPSARVVSVGPVFVEVETVAFNSTLGAVLPKTLKATTRTRIYKNGRLHFRSKFTAVDEIAVNTLWGTHGRISLPDIGLAPVEKRFFTLLHEHAETGNTWTFCLLRGTGDTHRDGVLYGPTRPNYWNVQNPGVGSTRLYGGWQFAKTDDKSLLNWPVEKGWTWVTEFFVDPESRYTTELDMLTFLYNRPVGRLGTPVYPGTLRRRLFRQFEDYCAGSMEWFRSPEAVEFGGTSDIEKQYYCHTWDIYQYYAHGKGSLQQVYENFRTYCNKAWGGFDTMGNAYTSGKLVLQFASRLVLPAYQWLYKAAKRDGNTVIMAAVSASMTHLATAIRVYLDSHSGVALSATDGGNGNSNSNATGMRVLALAVWMGGDADGTLRAAFDKCHTLISGQLYTYVKGVVTEGPGDVLNAYNWLHYQAYAINNYLIACDLLGVTPALDMSNYFMQAQNGSGGFNEIPYSVSESRRGQPNTIAFVSYPFIRSGRASAMAAIESAWQQFEEQHTARAGLTRRIYDFNPLTSSKARYEVSFNVAVLVDTMLMLDPQEAL
ncbi:hypothetical protein KFB51_13665 [Klebsiella pneumoniae]|uniref:hypothetical protein n=1 Tax=Klebsiella pneumoniae TaxID=573 RepID=UPI001CBBF657|nr:hypothetical protein [Klebsiella pneumoniae]MBZ1586694.1 hypothetical protein [Klebsiella pneumoniae]